MKFVKQTTLTFMVLISVAYINFSFAQPPKDTTEFIEQTSVRSMAIIGAAEIALEVSRSQEVKAFAQKFISEYETVMNGVRELAETKNIEIAEENELKDRAKNLIFKERDQNSFDVAYANNQLPAVQQMILMFQEAADSTDYEVRNFAVSTLPQLRRHLLMTEQLYAGTAETKTDIYHDRDNQLDSNNSSADDEQNRRVPTTDRLYP